MILWFILFVIFYIFFLRMGMNWRAVVESISPNIGKQFCFLIFLLSQFFKFFLDFLKLLDFWQFWHFLDFGGFCIDWFEYFRDFSCIILYFFIDYWIFRIIFLLLQFFRLLCVCFFFKFWQIRISFWGCWIFFKVSKVTTNVTEVITEHQKGQNKHKQC